MSPKRQNREGTFTRRADGTWHGKLGYADDSGAYRRISVYGASRGEVRAKLLDAAGRLSEGQPPKDSRLTVAPGPRRGRRARSLPPRDGRRRRR